MSRPVHKILVTPEGLVRELSAASLLERRALKIRSASDGDEALGMIDAWQPDLVVFASDLAGSVGVVEFADKARASSASPRLLMLTSELPDSVAQFDDIRTDAHLIQPFDQTQLLTTIGHLLNAELRAAERVDTEILARLDIPDDRGNLLGAESYLANIISLSATGCLLESESQLDIGGGLVARFVLPGTRERLIMAAVVVSADEPQLRYALRFGEPTEEEQARIQAYVQRRKQELRPFAAAGSPP